MRSFCFRRQAMAFCGALVISSAVFAAYPQWTEGTAYTAGACVSYQGHDYLALQTHTALSGAGWTPPTSPALGRIWARRRAGRQRPHQRQSRLQRPRPRVIRRGHRARSTHRAACASRTTAATTKANGGRKAISRARAAHTVRGRISVLAALHLRRRPLRHLRQLQHLHLHQRPHPRQLRRQHPPQPARSPPPARSTSTC